MSDETKCETNYSINNKWNNIRNKHLTKHDTNDDVDLDNCVVHTVRWALTVTIHKMVLKIIFYSPEFNRSIICTVHAWSMEEASKHGVLGRHQTCSKERIEVLSDTIERRHSLQYTPSLLYPESSADGNWRNHLRERIRITSTASEDFLETWLDEGIGFRSCSTQPTNPTKP